MKSNLASSTAQIQKDINQLYANVADIAGDSQFFKIVDGIVYITDAFNELSDSADMSFIEDQAAALQLLIDKYQELFKVYYDQTIKLEEEKAKEKNKKYTKTILRH